MLLLFTVILAALGAAFVLKGREARGLLVLLVAVLTVTADAAATGRWAWFAFTLALAGLVLIGLYSVRGGEMAAPEPESPAEPEPERSPDYCWTHQQVEPQEER